MQMPALHKKKEPNPKQSCSCLPSLHIFQVPFH
jgi:hypothetical protein